MEEQQQEAAIEQLTNWKNPPTVDALKKDMDKAMPAFHAHIQDVKTWYDNFHITGAVKLKKTIGYSNVQPQLIRKHAEWRYAALSEAFHTAPTLYEIKPRSHEDPALIEQAAKIVDYQLEHQIDRIAFIDKMVRTAVDEGTVALRISWIHEEKEIKVPVVLEDNGVVLGEALQKQSVVTKNQPDFEVVAYDRLIIDPDAHGKIEKAKFVIYKFATNIGELKKKGYKNLERIPMENRAVTSGEDGSNMQHLGSSSTPQMLYDDKARMQLEGYEYWGYWDIHDNGTLVPIYAIFVNGIMVHMDENPYPDKLPPFVIAHELPVRNSNYGEPDGALLVDQQNIVGAVTRGVIDLLGRSANGQVGIMEDALDPINQKRFKQGDDYTFRRNVDPTQAFFEHKFPEVPASAYQLIEMQLNDAEALTGVKTFGQGISGTSMGSVATSVRGALDASSKRESGILRRLAKGVEALGRKLVAMNNEFLSPEEVMAVTNKEYVPVPTENEHTILMDIRLKIRTIEQDNSAAQDLAFLTQTVGPNTDPGITKILMAKIAALKGLPDVEEAILNFEPKPDPMAEQMKQMELQKLQTDIQLAETKSQLQAMQAQLAQMKAMSEQPKAGLTAAETRKTHSQAQILDLEFTEEETGTNHERALDLAQAQARSNIDLEGFKQQNQVSQDSAKEMAKVESSGIKAKMPSPKMPQTNPRAQVSQ